MEITIYGEAKEIAALVVAIQERRVLPPEEFERMLDRAVSSLSSIKPGVILSEDANDLGTLQTED